MHVCLFDSQAVYRADIPRQLVGDLHLVVGKIQSMLSAAACSTNQPGPCLSEAVPGAGQSPAGARGSAPTTSAGQQLAAGPALPKRDARRWAGSGERGARPGRLVALGHGCHVGWVVACCSPRRLPDPYRTCSQGQGTPEGPPALPLLRAPGRAGIRRRGEQQSRGTGQRRPSRIW